MKYNNWNLTKLINTKKLLQDDFMQTNNESILDDLYLIEQIINDSISLFPIPISFYEKIWARRKNVHHHHDSSIEVSLFLRDML